MFGTTIEQSDSGTKHNPYTSIVAKVENSDAYLILDAVKTNEENEDMNISEKEEQKALVYQ